MAKSKTATKGGAARPPKPWEAVAEIKKQYDARIQQAERDAVAQLEAKVNTVVQQRIRAACKTAGVPSGGKDDINGLRAMALRHLKSKNLPVPPELEHEYTPIRLPARRMLADGSLETAAQAQRARERAEEEFTAGLAALRELLAEAAPVTEKDAKKTKAATETTTKTEKTKADKKTKSAEKAETRAAKKTDKAKSTAATSTKRKATTDDADDTASPTKRAKPNLPATAEHWNAGALGGDAARRSKFLRLLGAGKGGASGRDDQSGGGATAAQISKMQDELEQQFDAGIRMKHEGGARRRGLGA